MSAKKSAQKFFDDDNSDDRLKQVEQKLSKLYIIVWILVTAFLLTVAGAVAAYFILCSSSEADGNPHQRFAELGAAASTTQLGDPGCCKDLRAALHTLSVQELLRDSRIAKIEAELKELSLGITPLKVPQFTENESTKVEEDDLAFQPRLIIPPMSPIVVEEAKTDHKPSNIEDMAEKPDVAIQTKPTKDILMIEVVEKEGSGFSEKYPHHDYDSEISGDDSPFVDDEFDDYDESQPDEGSGSGHYGVSPEERPGHRCLQLPRPVCPDGCVNKITNSRGCPVPVCCGADSATRHHNHHH